MNDDPQERRRHPRFPVNKKARQNRIHRIHSMQHAMWMNARK